MAKLLAIRPLRNALGVWFHDWGAAIAPETSIGYKGAAAGAKVLAGTLLDLLSSPGLAKQCFAERSDQCVTDVV